VSVKRKMDAEQPVSKSIRGSTWSDEETRYLLNIWSEQKICSGIKRSKLIKFNPDYLIWVEHGLNCHSVNGAIVLLLIIHL
jgi:hypothetical protein